MSNLNLSAQAKAAQLIVEQQYESEMEAIIADEIISLEKKIQKLESSQKRFNKFPYLLTAVVGITLLLTLVNLSNKGYEFRQLSEQNPSTIYIK